MTVETALPKGFSLEKTTEAVEALVKYVRDSASKDRDDSKESGSKKLNLLADFADDDETTPLEAIDLAISTKKYSNTEKNLKPCVLPLAHSIRPKQDRNALSICIFTKDPESAFEKLLVEATKTSEDCLAALQAESAALKKTAAEGKPSKKSKSTEDAEDVADPEDTINYAQSKSGVPSLKELSETIRIDRVVSVSSLRGEFKPFQARRKLISEHDLFFAQDSIFDMLPGLLGKSFYKSSKSTPQIISMSRRTQKQIDEQKKVKLNMLNGKSKTTDSTEKSTETISLTKTLQQIYACYVGTSYILAPGTKLHMRVGSTSLTSTQNAENIVGAVSDFVAQHKAVSSWAGVRGIYIKTPSGPSLPVYLDDTPYETEDDVVEDEDELVARKREAEDAAKLEKKRKRSDRSHIEQLLEEVVDEEDLTEFLEKRNHARIEAKKEAKKAKLAASAEKKVEATAAPTETSAEAPTTKEKKKTSAAKGSKLKSSKK